MPSRAGESQRSVLSAGSSADLMVKGHHRHREESYLIRTVWSLSGFPLLHVRAHAHTLTHTHTTFKNVKIPLQVPGFPQANVRTHTHTNHDRSGDYMRGLHLES